VVFTQKYWLGEQVAVVEEPLRMEIPMHLVTAVMELTHLLLVAQLLGVAVVVEVAQPQLDTLEKAAMAAVVEAVPEILTMLYLGL
jgi:hypothetical protein